MFSSHFGLFLQIAEGLDGKKSNQNNGVYYQAVYIITTFVPKMYSSKVWPIAIGIKEGKSFDNNWKSSLSPFTPRDEGSRSTPPSPEGPATSHDLVVPALAPRTGVVANAGSPRSVSEGSLVTLDGTGSKARSFFLLGSGGNSISSYSWSQISGTPVTVTDGYTATPTFTAPTVAGRLEFSLTVKDIAGEISTPATAPNDNTDDYPSSYSKYIKSSA
jgi:hypothetical protein